jgi:hypothetical protein
VLSVAVPTLTPKQVAHFAQQVAEYISSGRLAYLNAAATIQVGHRAALTPFFPADLLTRTLVSVVVQPVENPSFYPTLRQMGFNNLPDFSKMAAITFVDVVVSHVQIASALLFHEMVHVVQYNKLGLSEFSRHYVEGFLRSGSYERIPLEINAYQLEERFRANPYRQFSVEAEVRQWIDAGRY